MSTKTKPATNHKQRTVAKPVHTGIAEAAIMAVFAAEASAREACRDAFLACIDNQPTVTGLAAAALADKRKLSKATIKVTVSCYGTAWRAGEAIGRDATEKLIRAAYAGSGTLSKLIPKTLRDAMAAAKDAPKAKKAIIGLSAGTATVEAVAAKAPTAKRGAKTAPTAPEAPKTPEAPTKYTPQAFADRTGLQAGMVALRAVAAGFAKHAEAARLKDVRAALEEAIEALELVIAS